MRGRQAVPVLDRIPFHKSAMQPTSVRVADTTNPGYRQLMEAKAVLIKYNLRLYKLTSGDLLHDQAEIVSD